MFENFYKNGALDIIESSFDIEISDEIKYTLCNIKLISLFKKFDEFVDLRKHEKKDIYENVEGITYEDFYNILDDNQFYYDVIDRSFVKCYEIFEKTIEEIISYIHYKKLDIVLNKKSTITCDKLKCNNIEELIEQLIKTNIGTIVYNKGIKDMISFINRYSKSNIDEMIIKAVFVQSKLRNALVHDKGLVDNRIVSLMNGIFDIETDLIPESGKFKFALEIDNVISSTNIYKKVISCIIADMKEQFETN